MKKSYLFGLCAASMLLTTSCQKDNLFGMWQDNKNEPVTVKMSVSLPEMQSATRAGEEKWKFGAGNHAQNLNYAVYEIIRGEVTKDDGQTVTKDIDTLFLSAQQVTDRTMNGQKSTSIALKLIPGNTYEVVFWAQNHKFAADDAPYTVNFNKVVGDAVVAEVTLDYAKLYTNNEINDAFMGKTRIESDKITLDGGSVIDLGEVKLRRPFAQLNIGTADLKAAENAGFKVEKVSVTIPNNDDNSVDVYDVINLWDDSNVANKPVAENETPKDKVYKVNAIPDNTKWEFPVEDGKYDFLAMNYLLTSADKKVLNSVTVKYIDSKGREKTRTFSNVPIQRNWRTNIYGDLITSDVKLQVTIDPLFADETTANDDSELEEEKQDADDRYDYNGEKPDGSDIK